MIIDQLSNAALYASLHTGLGKAFRFMQETDLRAITPGRHTIDGDAVFAIVSDYETVDAAKELLEAHRKYIDVQYMVSGVELIGHALLRDQAVHTGYDVENDFILYADAPSFFSRMEAGTFMIFFPSDLHMPGIIAGQASSVKKVVIKVRI